MSRVLNAVGPITADIYIVGEAPGRVEERVGIPFVGSAGKVLNRLLKSAGIDRSKCRVNNVCGIRPPGNDFGHFYKDSKRKEPTQELLDQRARLYEDIRLVKPNVIVAMGNEALKALTGKDFIMKWRGSILDTELGKVIPTIHPASVLRNWGYYPIVVSDLIRVKEESKSPEVDLPQYTLITAPTFSQVEAEADLLMESEYIAFDIETVKGGDEILCIGFCGESGRAICVPFTSSKGSYWPNVETEANVWLLVAKVLENGAKKIAQNAQFDVTVLARNNVIVRNLYLDTMLAHHTIHPELPKSLAFLTSIYTRQPFYKDMIHGNLWKYNCLDAIATYDVAMALLRELKEFGTRSFYFRQVHPMIEPLMHIQAKGVRSDEHLRKLLRDFYSKRLKENQRILDEAVGYSLNVMSPKQMGKFLYEELGLKERISRKTHRRTVNEEALKAMAKKYNSQVFDLILKIREDRKMLSTFIEMPLGEDKRVRTTYSIGGTLSGRLASHAYIDGTGGNLQNIPKEPIRKLLVPDDNKVFIGADLSQAEARVVAYLAEELSQIAAFESGEDIHIWNAASIFQKDKEDVTPGERYIAKRLVHAANYGISPRGFAAVVGCSISDAKDALKRYYTAFPAIKIWHLSIQNELKRSRILKTPLGRKRMFFDRMGPILLRQAYSYIPQSTVADVVNRAMVRLYWSLPEGTRVVLNVHDALVCECDESQVEDVKRYMTNAFNCPITIHGRTFVIPSEFKVGKSWYEVS